MEINLRITLSIYMLLSFLSLGLDSSHHQHRWGLRRPKMTKSSNILKSRYIPEIYSNVTDSAELVHNHEQSLELADILPIKARSYDKNRAPKLLGQPTVVYFHVTVLSIDSINEESMTYVTDIFLAQRYFVAILLHMPSVYLRLFFPIAFVTKLARPTSTTAREYERRIPNTWRRLAPFNLEARLLL